MSTVPETEAYLKEHKIHQLFEVRLIPIPIGRMRPRTVHTKPHHTTHASHLYLTSFMILV